MSDDISHDIITKLRILEAWTLEDLSSLDNSNQYNDQGNNKKRMNEPSQVKCKEAD